MTAESYVLEAVSRHFGSVVAIESLTLSIKKDEFVAFVGPSGCGKTTLLNVLSGNDKPTSGIVHCTGKSRMIHQSDGLFPWLTVRENIHMGVEALPKAQWRFALYKRSRHTQ